MNNPKFTQGEWKIDEHYSKIRITGYEFPFALHLYGQGRPENWQEILNIAGAAPDMYAVLDTIYHWFDNEDTIHALPSEPSWYQALRDALAKARGE